MSRGSRSNRPAARSAARTALASGLALVALGAGVVGCAKKDEVASEAPAGSPAAAFALTKDAGAAIKASGLPALSSEGTAVHYHAHLDVNVNDQAIPVPANIGIDLATKTISPLHTHTPDGIVHIEAPAEDEFTLGQLFTEWGVKLDKSCVATFCADGSHQLLAFKNGQPQPDPAAIVFTEHDEIVVWYGPTGTTPKVPTSYEFKGGL